MSMTALFDEALFDECIFDVRQTPHCLFDHQIFDLGIFDGCPPPRQGAFARVPIPTKPLRRLRRDEDAALLMAIIH